MRPRAWITVCSSSNALFSSPRRWRRLPALMALASVLTAAPALAEEILLPHVGDIELTADEAATIIAASPASTITGNLVGPEGSILVFTAEEEDSAITLSGDNTGFDGQVTLDGPALRVSSRENLFAKMSGFTFGRYLEDHGQILGALKEYENASYALGARETFFTAWQDFQTGLLSNAATIVTEKGQTVILDGRQGATQTLTLGENGSAGRSQGLIKLESGAGFIFQNQHGSGAVRVDKGSLALIGEGNARFTFLGNQASHGGAVTVNNGGVLRLDGADFFGNSAKNTGGALRVDKGSVVGLTDVDFVNNQANYGSAIYADSRSFLMMTGGRVVGNQSIEGGAVYSPGTMMSFDSVVMSANKAVEGYGGAVNSAGPLELRGPLVFTNNQAGDSDGKGGAVHAAGAVSLYLDQAFQSALFVGNNASKANNSIHLESADLTLNLDSKALVDMRDPFSGNGATVIQNGGLWKLGGQTILRDGSSVAIQSGTLHLYREGEAPQTSGALAAGRITMEEGGIFKIAGLSRLSLGGGNVIEADSIVFGLTGDDKITLTFDVGAAACGPFLTLQGAGNEPTAVTVGGDVAIDLKSLNYDPADSIVLISGGNWAGFNGVRPTLRGEDVSNNERLAQTTLTLAGNAAGLTLEPYEAPESLILEWNGGSGQADWNITSGNWKADGQGAQFLHGDLVNFSSDGAEKQIIRLNPGEAGGDGTIQVAGLYFSGQGSYAFEGLSITADGAGGTSLVGDAAASGKLVLGRRVTASGFPMPADFTGMVDLTKTVTNDFKGGIDLHSGALVIADAAQLGSCLKGVSFKGDEDNTPILRIASGQTVTFAGGRNGEGSLNLSAGYYGRISLEAGSVLNLIDNHTSRREAGGAIHLTSGHLALNGDENSKYVFSGNQANNGLSGGAIALFGSTDGPASLDIAVSSFFSGNAAEDGGAIYFYGANRLHLKESAVFTGNRAESNGGALSLLIYNGGAAALNNADFIGNTAGGRGGAIYLAQGGLTLSVDGSRTSVFTGNTHLDDDRPNSIFLGSGGGDDDRLTLNIEAGSTLDMNDPLGGEAGSAWLVRKTGGGAWKLGGDNTFADDGGGSGSVLISIDEGVLSLYREAAIDLNLNRSAFVLDSGAALISAGGNIISAVSGLESGQGKIEFKEESSLGFDLRKLRTGETGLTITADNVIMASPVVNLTSVRIGEWSLITVTGKNISDYELTLNPGTDGGSRYAYTLTGTESEAGRGYDTLGLTVTLADVNKNLIWQGGAAEGDLWRNDGPHSWLDADKTEVPALGFAENDFVTFGLTGINHNSIIIGDDGLRLAGMEITGGQYSFSGGGLVSSSVDDEEIKGGTVKITRQLAVSGPDTVAGFDSYLNFEKGILITGGAELILGGQGALADGQKISLGSGSILTFDKDADYVLNAGSITGSDGRIVKAGSGLMSINSGLGEGLTDFSGFSGTLTVTDGTLSVKGDLGENLTVQVAADAKGVGTLILGDGGRIADLLVQEGGIFTAYKGDGPLTVQGSLSGLDKAEIKILTDDWRTGTDYTLLTVSDAADLADFTAIRDESLLAGWTITASGRDLNLHIKQTRTIGDIFQGSRLSGAAEALTDLGAGDKLYQMVGDLGTEAEAAEALKSLTGSLQTAAPGAALSYDARVAAGTVLNHLSGQIRSVGGNQPSFGDGDARPHRLWFSYGYNRTRYGDRTSTLKGPEAWLGYDFDGAGDWLIGGALRFTKQDLKNIDGKSEIESLGAALYAGRSFRTAGPGTPRLSFGLIGSHHDLDTSRVARVGDWQETLTSERHGSTWQVFAEGSWAFQAYDWLEVAPYLNISWSRTNISGTTEKGTLTALKLTSQTDSNAATTLGLRLTADPADSLSLGLNLGWNHTYGELDRAVTVGFDRGGRRFSSEGPQLARDILEADLRLSAQFNERLGVSLQYEGGYGEDYRRHAGSVTIDSSW